LRPRGCLWERWTTPRSSSRRALFETPLLLSKVQAPERPLLVILDALDELPKESQKPLLAVIASQFSQLPPWLKLFVTSREEPQITRAFSSFKPKELRADEVKNRADDRASCAGTSKARRTSPILRLMSSARSKLI
jgi:hypothetical protein